MTPSSRALGLSLIGLLLGACHKKQQKGPPAFELTCEKNCQRVHACNEEVDLEECRANCFKLYAPYGDRLNKEYLKEIDQCMADARCSDLGVSASDNGCRRDASDRVGASLAVVHYCERLSTNRVRRRGPVCSIHSEPRRQSG